MVATQFNFNVANSGGTTSDGDSTRKHQSGNASESTTITVRTAAITDESAIIATMVLAFSRDPAARWLYSDPHQYLKDFPKFVQAFGGKAFVQETAYCTDGHAGAALWFPPTVEPDNELIVEQLQSSIAETNQSEVFAVLEQMEQYHPKAPHWYLPILGVEPTQQGKGYGSALMQHVLMQCDRDRLPAYLEASKPANVPFYQQHGFEVLGIIQVEASPPIIPMFRHPR